MQVFFTRSGSSLPCGSTVSPCEKLGVSITTKAGEARAKGDGNGFAFIIEATGATFLLNNVPDASCPSRTTNDASPVVMPPTVDKAVTLRYRSPPPAVRVPVAVKQQERL